MAGQLTITILYSLFPNRNPMSVETSAPMLVLAATTVLLKPGRLGQYQAKSLMPSCCSSSSSQQQDQLELEAL